MIRPYQRFIQMARRELGLDDQTYRDFLENAAGRRSTKDMTDRELWRVVEALKKKGLVFESKVKPDGPQAGLVRHLWLELKNEGVLRDASERALRSYVRRITGCDRMEWLNNRQMNTLIESLKSWLARLEETA